MSITGADGGVTREAARGAARCVAVCLIPYYLPSCGHSSLILKTTLLQRLSGAPPALHSINLLLLSLQARPLLLLQLPGLVLLGGQDGLLDDRVGKLRGEERDILCKQPERAAALGERDVRQAALTLGEEALGGAVPVGEGERR